MTELLIKLFLRGKDGKDGKDRASFATLASVVGIIVNVILFGAKLTAGLLASSVAVIGDALNNISDAGSAVILFIGFRLALKPVDKDHPLGHGRLEYITGFIVDMLIILVGVELLKSSVEKIIGGGLPTVTNLTVILLAVSVLFKLWLFVFYRKIAKRIDSAAIKATATDSISDCFATSVVLVSSLLAKGYNIAIDGYAGILVAAFILFAGAKAGKETIGLLLGTPPSKEYVAELSSFTKNYQGIIGIHDLVVHDYGVGRQFISFHAEVPSDCDICAMHDVIDNLERDMHEKFGAIVTVHMDPIDVKSERTAEMKEYARRKAKEVDERFEIHDFRMTDGGDHVNLIFDLVVPVEVKTSTEECAKAVAEKIRQGRENTNAVISAEHPYV